MNAGPSRSSISARTPARSGRFSARTRAELDARHAADPQIEPRILAVNARSSSARQRVVTTTGSVFLDEMRAVGGGRR